MAEDSRGLAVGTQALARDLAPASIGGTAGHRCRMTGMEGCSNRYCAKGNAQPHASSARCLYLVQLGALHGVAPDVLQAEVARQAAVAALQGLHDGALLVHVQQRDHGARWQCARPPVQLAQDVAHEAGLAPAADQALLRQQNVVLPPIHADAFKRAAPVDHSMQLHCSGMPGEHSKQGRAGRQHTCANTSESVTVAYPNEQCPKMAVHCQSTSCRLSGPARLLISQPSMSIVLGMWGIALNWHHNA